MEPHLPPPPYSETDIYSVSSGQQARLTPSASTVDNASVAGTRPALSTTSSSVDEPIFTPPYSPASSFHQNQVVGEEELEDVPVGGTSSAAAYFAARPVRRNISPPAFPEPHRITITRNTEPKDLPYPQTLSVKDVTQQDWATFVNFLLPHHIAIVNNDVADRKLQAEMLDERFSGLNIGSDNLSRSDPSEVDAQLSHLRHPQAAGPTIRVLETRYTIAEWNESFFGPRGVHIILVDAEASEKRVPGAWVPSEHENATDRSRAPLPGAWIPAEDENAAEGSRAPALPEARRTWGPFGGFGADSRGFRMGPMQADNGGFRIGNMLVADQNGFRLGGSRGFVADANGVSFGGRTFGPGPSRDPNTAEARRGRLGHHRGRSHSRGWRGKGKERARSRSSDSSSSSSSSSSSDSDNSVGSLPDYEDLRDQQLPVAKQSLLEWLNHPEQPLTREAVQRMKQDLKTAHRDGSVPTNQDLAALRRDVKELMKRFKEGKKAQKKQWREAKRARRAAKRAAKKERRTERREARKSRKEERACGGERGQRGRGGNRGNRGPESPSVPNFMPNFMGSGPRWGPGMPIHSSGPTPPMFPVPPMPGAFPNMPPNSIPHLGRGNVISPGMAARHGGWPFTGSMSRNVPFGFGGMPGGFAPAWPGGLSDARQNDHGEEHGEVAATSAEQMYTQASQLDKEAHEKEERATILRTEATRMEIGEKERHKMRDEATRLEEEAERERREAERLRGEAEHLDGELAREMGGEV